MNKGFTLIELLGVIVLLGVIALIAVPAINNTMNQGKASLSETQEKQIVKAAKDYYIENYKLLPSAEGGSVTVTVKTLQDNGYLPLNIKDPKNNKEYSPSATKVTVTKNGKSYSYEVTSVAYLG